VPGARVPRLRATPVQMGSNSRLPPHAGCCCHSDACGGLSTGSTGVSPGDPYSRAATDATSTAAHSARSASVPESVTQGSRGRFGSNRENHGRRQPGPTGLPLFAACGARGAPLEFGP